MSSFWRVLTYLKNYKAYTALAIFSNLLTAVFTVVGIPLLIPFLNILFDRVEKPIDTAELNWTDLDSISANLQLYFWELMEQVGREQALVYVCIAILISFFLKNLFRYLALFFFAPVRNGVTADIRQELFGKMLALPLSFFSEERKGDLMSRMTSDVIEVEQSILNMLVAVFREPLIIIGALALMVSFSPSLTVFVFALLLFTGLVIGYIGKSLRRPSSEVQRRLGALISKIEEALSGLRIIKGFNAEPYQEEKFSEENQGYSWTLTHLLWRKDLASPLSEFLGIGVVAVLLWFGSRQVFSGALEASTFLSFIFAFYNVIEPAKSFSKAFYNIQKGSAAMDRIETILDAPNPIAQNTGQRPLPGFQHAIEYRDVSFRYRPQDHLVLEHIQLKVPKGKVVALVGASGAGKSTLVDLLPRFYDVTAGGIFIDGVDIREFRLKDLRQLMGIVSQEAILFNDTIYNNIVFGMEGVSEEQVQNAARIANAHDFIMATEKGYQTNIGDRGNNLSGGQRQRLTIARAILKNPPILILDEATSALDSESEQLVQAALLELMKERTSIVIAHRLSTIQHADEIVVMGKGKIIERGTHDRLLRKDGEYHKLVELQTF